MTGPLFGGRGPIDVGAVTRAHDRFLGRQQVAIVRALDWAGDFAEDHVAAYSKFRRRSAQSLKDATEHKFVRTGSGVVVRIFSTKKYAEHVEYGTKPHIIRARRAKALRFVMHGKTHFRRWVRHPGTKGFRFLYNATTAGFRVLGQKLEHDLGALARQF